MILQENNNLFMGWELSCRPSSADCVDNKFGSSAGEHPLQLYGLRAALLEKAFSGMFTGPQDASEISTPAEKGGRGSETGCGTSFALSCSANLVLAERKTFLWWQVVIKCLLESPEEKQKDD